MKNLLFSLPHRARRWTRATWILLTVLALIVGATAQDVTGTMLRTMARISGPPSRAKMVSAKRNVTKAARKTDTVRRQRTEKRRVRRNANYERVKTYRRKPPQKTTRPTVRPTAKPVVKPTTKPAVKPTVKPVVKPTVKPVVKPTKAPVRPVAPPPQPAPQPEIVEDRQNVIFAFLNPRGESVPNLAVTATVRDQSGAERTLDDLRTDGQGRVLLANLELPVAVDVDINNADWQVSDVEAASLVFVEPQGNSRLVQRPIFNKFNCAAPLPADDEPTRVAVNPTMRTRIYDANAQIVAVERTVVDVELHAPATCEVSTPALPGQNLTVPADGSLNLRLPTDVLGEGAIPLRLSKTLPGGQSETVVEDYPVDPYKPNLVTAPPLQLVTLDKLTLVNGVTSGLDVVKAKLGDLNGKENKKNQLGKINELADGSEWWVYPARGVAYKMRPLPSASEGDIKKNRAAMLSERVHFEAPSRETFGGIGIGSSLDDVRANLGAPQIENENNVSDDKLATTGQTDVYLEGGLRVFHRGGKVMAIDLARPNELLQNGTTAFVPRRPATLYVENFGGNPNISLRDTASFVSFLRQGASIRVVDNRDDADLILDARVSEFYEDKDQITELLPYRYDCRTKLNYSLFDTTQQKLVYDKKESVGKAKVDYTKDAALVGITAGVLRKKLGDWVYLIVGFGIAELHEGMRKAANRCPAIATRTAFAGLMDDVDEAADFSARVTEIDYARGLLTINAGARDGVRVSTPDRPFEWSLKLGDRPLPEEDTPTNADFYVARVVSVSADKCVCEMRHRVRRIKKTKESEKDDPALDMLKRLPDPATGLLEARASVRFPDMKVISEEDVRRANAAAERESEALPEETKSADGAPAKSNPLGDLLGGLLGKSKAK